MGVTYNAHILRSVRLAKHSTRPPQFPAQSRPSVSHDGSQQPSPFALSPRPSRARRSADVRVSYGLGTRDNWVNCPSLNIVHKACNTIRVIAMPSSYSFHVCRDTTIPDTIRFVCICVQTAQLTCAFQSCWLCFTTTVLLGRGGGVMYEKRYRLID